MGIWQFIKSGVKSAIDKVKQVGSSAINLVGKGAVAVYQGVKSGASKVVDEAKVIGGKVEDIITAPAKAIESIFKSPTTLILVAVAGVGAIVVLPKLIK